MDKILEIPGYYYDREKKKYFKTLSSSSAPASSAYSSRDVKRRKIIDERVAMDALNLGRQKGRIKKSPILEAPSTGGFMARQLGHSAEIDAASIYAAGLTHQGCGRKIQDYALLAVIPRPDLEQGIVDIFMGGNDCSISTTRANTDVMNADKRHNSLEFCREYSRTDFYRASRLEALGFRGTSTSMSVNEECERLALTWMPESSSAREGIAVVPTQRLRADKDYDAPAIVVGTGDSRGNAEVWSSTPAPPQSSLLFAFGTDQGLITVDKERVDAAFVGGHHIYPGHQQMATFAIEFGHDAPSVLLSGGRSGILSLSDLRRPTFEADADIITHPSSITHIKHIEKNRIIVAGLNSNLCQYDLRFPKAITQSIENNCGGNKNLRPTRSILDYPGYRNDATVHMGLDVDVETGVIAVGKEDDGTENSGDENRTTELFSLYGGNKLYAPMWRTHGIGHNTPDSAGNSQIATSVKFARDSDDQVKSLYTYNQGLMRYAWTLEQEKVL